MQQGCNQACGSVSKSPSNSSADLISFFLSDDGGRFSSLGERTGRPAAEGALFWEAVPDYWTRHAMRPEITGLAQVRGLRGATEKRSNIEKRVGTDLEFINSWLIWLDIKILLQTIRVVFH